MKDWVDINIAMDRQMNKWIDKWECEGIVND